MSRLIWDSDAIDALKLFGAEHNAIAVIKGLPSAEPNILDDGTLTITVPHGMLSKVNRVIVDEVGTKFCKMMYQEEPQIIRCKDCVHWKHSNIRPNYCDVWDWCNQADDFCSFAERREEE